MRRADIRTFTRGFDAAHPEARWLRAVIDRDGVPGDARVSDHAFDMEGRVDDRRVAGLATIESGGGFDQEFGAAGACRCAVQRVADGPAVDDRGFPDSRAGDGREHDREDEDDTRDARHRLIQRPIGPPRNMTFDPLLTARVLRRAVRCALAAGEDTDAASRGRFEMDKKAKTPKKPKQPKSADKKK